MNNKVVLVGKIEFEPENITKKHNTQSPWKRIAMVTIDGDVTEYYSWFIEKRYNLKLNKPLRRAHISFINDSIWDIKKSGEKTITEVNELWNNVKKKWDGVKVPIMLDLSPRFNEKYCWLNIPHEYRDKLQSIRNELGLGKPHFGLHMTIGRGRDGYMEDHLKYIYNCIKNGLIN